MKSNVAVLFCTVLSALAAFGTPNGIADGSVTRPIIIPHRGMWDEKVPQNTVEAIRRAYEAGAVCVETDFHHTRHGQMVCIHTRKDLERYTGFTCDFWDKAFKWADELGMDYRPVAIRKSP